MRKSSKLRFLLGTLIVVFAALTIWRATTTIAVRDQRAAARAAVGEVESREGIVGFEATLDMPQWLRNAVGEAHFHEAKSVSFGTDGGKRPGTNRSKASDATLVLLASLRSIETLELSHNGDVTDSGMLHLKTLTNLKTVYLHRTGIRGPGLVYLVDLPHLEGISLGNTQLAESGLAHIGRMARLKWARLDNTKVTDAGMPELAKATALKTLTLRNTEITDTGLMHLARLDQLETLDVLGTQVTSDGIARLKNALPNCRITATFGLGETPQDELLFQDGHWPTPAEINAKLKAMKIDGEVQVNATRRDSPIVTFRLFESRFSDNVVLDLINHMPELEILNLRRGLVGDDLAKGVSGLQNIQYLSLQGTRITDDGLQHLSRLPNLTELILIETDITDAGLVHLQDLKTVQSIMLDDTRVTSDGIERLRQSLPNCRVQW